MDRDKLTKGVLSALCYFFMFKIFRGKVPAFPQVTWDDTFKQAGRIYDSLLGEAYQDSC
jgi:hypothetical protein